MKNYNLVLISLCLLFLTIPSKNYKEKLSSQNEEENKENLNLRNLISEEEEAVGPTNYHKSSGGLSTGGVVGITIAGIVVVVAAITIAIILKGTIAVAAGTGVAITAGNVGTVGGVVTNPTYMSSVQYNVPNHHINADNSGVVMPPHP